MRPMPWPETLQRIVADYRSNDIVRAREVLWWRADGCSFAEMLDRVGYARTEKDQRHPHQRRLGRGALEAGAAALRARSADLQRAGDFFSVFRLVEDAFAPIRGLGELAVYDAADRICLRLGHEPTLIYLHAGTRAGARRLRGGRLAREEAWAMHHRQLPEGLLGLSNREAEDVLCIYKDVLLTPPDRLEGVRRRRLPCLGDMPTSSC